MSKGNLLFISPTGTFDNGAEISMFYLMEHLVGLGYQVYNIAPQAFHQKQTEYYDRYEQHGITTHFIPCLKWWWEDAPGGQPGTLEERAAFYRENVREISSYIKEKQIELVITNTVNMFQGALAATNNEIPHFWLIHEFPTGEFGYYHDKADFISEFSDEIYCVTGELHAALKELFPNRIVKTFAPYTQINVTEHAQGKKRRIVSVGRLTERKNQLELIKAYEKLNVADVELVFIGAWDDAYKQKCDIYIKEHKLKNITFIGNRENPWQDVTEQDLCVFPSALETFGLVYVEALLNGIPVILSDNPGHLSAYGLFEFGKLYPTGDIEQLASEIKNSLANFSAEKERAEAFVPTAEKKYQIEMVYQEIIKSIEEKPQTKPKAVRHVANLYSTNEAKSRLTRLEAKGRRFYNKVKVRLSR